MVQILNRPYNYIVHYCNHTVWWLRCTLWTIYKQALTYTMCMHTIAYIISQLFCLLLKQYWMLSCILFSGTSGDGWSSGSKRWQGMFSYVSLIQWISCQKSHRPSHKSTATSIPLHTCWWHLVGSWFSLSQICHIVCGKLNWLISNSIWLYIFLFL